MPIEFSKISSYQLDSIDREKAVFFFPVGPLEDHGPHLPLGLDLGEAARLCHLAAKRLEDEMPGWVGLVMPAAPLGIDSNTTRFQITVRPHVLRDWLVDCCQSLMKSGFIHFVCFSGHLGPRQLTAIEDASQIVRRKGYFSKLRRIASRRGLPVPTLVSASSGLVPWREVLKSPFWPDPEEHGGRKDTAVALAISERLVSPSYSKLPSLEREVSRWSRNWKRRRGQLAGYWGSPSAAEAQYGEQVLKEEVDQIFSKLRAVWNGANPRFLFKSWYSILPPNKSFFKSWVLFGFALFFTLSWLWLSFTSYQID